MKDTLHEHCPSCGVPMHRLAVGLPYLCYYCGAKLMRLHQFIMPESSQFGVLAPWAEAVKSGLNPKKTRQSK